MNLIRNRIRLVLLLVLWAAAAVRAESITSDGCLSVTLGEGVLRNDLAQDMLREINAKREDAGLGALQPDEGLLSCARTRAAELCLCLGHQRPDGTMFDLMDPAIADESIAAGFSAEEILEKWFQEENGNILDPDLCAAGIACFETEDMLFSACLFGFRAGSAGSFPGNQTLRPVVAARKEMLFPVVLADNEEIQRIRMEKGGKCILTVRNVNSEEPGIRVRISQESLFWNTEDAYTASVERGILTGRGGGDTSVSLSLGEGEPSCLTIPVSVSGEKTDIRHIAVYRLFNAYSGEHFFTANAAEKERLLRLGYKGEGTAFYAPSGSGDAVLRLYNPKRGFEAHHYTADGNEVRILVSQGWRREGTAWYSDLNREKPVFRLFDPRGRMPAASHLFTADSHERRVLLAQGYRDEGIAWYALGTTNEGS